MATHYAICWPSHGSTSWLTRWELRRHTKRLLGNVEAKADSFWTLALDTLFATLAGAHAKALGNRLVDV